VMEYASYHIQMPAYLDDPHWMLCFFSLLGFFIVAIVKILSNRKHNSTTHCHHHSLCQIHGIGFLILFFSTQGLLDGVRERSQLVS
jgi:hypothetical protein